MAARKVTFSRMEKVYFPSGYTKGDMIRYYAKVAPAMLPHLRNRPVTLIRFPDGVKGEKFYEKNAPGHAPDWVRTCRVPRRHEEGAIRYLLINDVATLTWCANLGAIEFHPFLHRAGRLDAPTQVAFDLDPGEGSDILDCVEAARILKDVLDRAGLNGYPKVSGSKGLQVYVPLNTPTKYDSTNPFAKAVAELMAREHPRLIVSEMPKLLRKGRVLVDWSQNSEAKTTVCAYSLRGKHDEPFVSLPVTWSELERAAAKKNPEALFFTPKQALERIARLGDLFAPVLREKQHLPKPFQHLSESAPRATRGPLARYDAKRDFQKTAEPGPGKTSTPSKVKAKAKGKNCSRFVIQKHAATRLHYDFRLEEGGTLKSWAVPKGMPYALGVKRAAFEVEDHPIEYLKFEGTIPKGQYGGGTVMVWDIGTYELIGGDWKRGDLKLRLHGKKLDGDWHLFRIRNDESKPVWLMIKSGKAARPPSARKEDASALTGRSMARIASDNDRQWKSR